MTSSHFLRGWLALATAVLLCAPSTFADDGKSAAPNPPDAEKDSQTAPPKDKDGWRPLFNGRDLEGWKVTKFGGEGEVLVEDGEIVIMQGVDLSGLHTEQKIPKSNYAVEFEAQRAGGSDFFAGLTFPVKDSFCSLIIGGWGGGVCGLSSLSGMDASENETTSYHQFESGKWYKIRLEVRDDSIKAWIDDKSIVDADITGHRIGVRFEVERSKPFGFSTWQTTARLRNARLRELPADDGAAKPD